MAHTGKPTIEIMEAELNHFTEIWQPGIDAAIKNESFYHGTYNIWRWFATPGEATPAAIAGRANYHSGRGHALIKHAVDANLAMFPQWHRPPIGKGKEHKDAAERIEKGLDAVGRDAFLIHYAHPPKASGKDMVSQNYAAIYVGLDAVALSTRPTKIKGEGQDDFEQREWEWEVRRNGWNPIRIEGVPIGSVFMDPTLKTPDVAYRVRKLRSYQLHDLTVTKAAQLKTLGEVIDIHEIGADPYNEITVIERFAPDYYSIRLAGNPEGGGDNGMLWIEKNTWGFVPFAQAWAGESTELIGQGFKTKDMVEGSMLHHAADTLVMHDQAVVAHHQLLQRTAWAKTGYRGSAAEAATQLEGDILSGDELQWWLEKVPVLAAQSFQHLQYLRDQLEEITYSMQLAGYHQTGVDTATQAIMLSESSNRKIISVRTQLEALYSIAGTYVLRLVKRLADEYPDVGDIVLGKEKLSSKDIGDNYKVFARFESVDPVVFAQQKQEAREEVAAGFLDWEGYQRIARRENIQEVRKNIIKDTIKQLPRVLAQEQEFALREEGFGKLANEMERERRVRSMVDQSGNPLFPDEGGNDNT